MEKLVLMDLFAGAGGLSFGFKQTGCFDINVAVEYDENARKTYLKNHPGVHIEHDIRKVDFYKVVEEYGRPNIVIGGPPCQGFSNANRQKNTLISGNNQLVKEYIRAIEETDPDAFVFENVKTIDSDTHKFFCSREEKSKMDTLGVKLKYPMIPIADATFFSKDVVDLIKRVNSTMEYIISKEYYNVLFNLYRLSQNEDKFNKYLVKNRKLIDKLILKWDEAHISYCCEGYSNTYRKLKDLLVVYLDKRIDFNRVVENLKMVIETQKVFNKLNEINRYNVELLGIICDDQSVQIKVCTYSVVEFLEARLKKLGYVIEKGILNAANFGVPQVRERFILVGVKKEKLKEDNVKLPDPILKNANEFFSIGQAIGDIAKYNVSVQADKKPNKKSKYDIYKNPLKKYLNDWPLLHNHVSTDSTDIALERFKELKPGQNFHDLDESKKTTYTDPDRTQMTIYKRLKYDEVSGTVVNVRKSMWIHPTKNRAISIREAARLQSFPDSFIFLGTKDSMYQQVGNAVPPLMARAIAERVLGMMGVNLDTKLENIIK